MITYICDYETNKPHPAEMKVSSTAFTSSVPRHVCLKHARVALNEWADSDKNPGSMFTVGPVDR